LVCEEYFYGHGKETKHQIASVTKSVVSLLVGIAIDKGFIPDVDRKGMDYFPLINWAFRISFGRDLKMV
jgi:CubicO group peptidase (beta-lactamase class C family)